MSLEFDFSEVVELAADFARAPDIAANEVRAVVQKGALNVKRDWQSRWRGLSSAPALPDAITFDTKMTADSAEAEIGPDKSRRQGALGNIIEFGTRNNSPRPAGGPALKAEAPRFVKALEDVLQKALAGGR